MKRSRSLSLSVCAAALASLAFAAFAFVSAPPAARAQSAMPMPSPAVAPARTAAPAPTPAPSPNAAEAAFLKRIMTNLPKLYPNPQAATAAGWIRYSREDRTGAISYVNTKYWDTTDPDHPAQLWYDVNGRLLGADFSIPQAESSTGPPNRFGIDPSRWFKLSAHVHYVQRNPNGTVSYGKAMSAQRYADANNGDYSHPTAAGLVAAKGVTDAASVPFVFLYPSIYDVTVWVVPNPLGQFADKNPAVTPSPRAGSGEDEPM